jgi:hypothetical protein
MAVHTVRILSHEPTNRPTSSDVFYLDTFPREAFGFAAIANEKAWPAGLIGKASVLRLG